MHIFLLALVIMILVMFFFAIIPKLINSGNKLTTLQKEQLRFQKEFDLFYKNNQEKSWNEFVVSSDVDSISEHTLYYKIVLKDLDYNYENEEKMNKIETGDEYFDRNIYMFSSDNRRIISKLGEDMRNKIIDLNNTVKIRIEDNKIIMSSIEKINLLNPDTIMKSIDILRLLNNIEDVDQMLINNIKTDPLDNVRIQNLKMLVESKNKKKYQSLLKELQNDENMEIAVIALINLEEKDKKKIQGLLKSEKRNVVLTVLKYIDMIKFDSGILTSLYSLLKINDEEIVWKTLNILSKKNIGKTEKKIVEICTGNNPPFNYSKKIRLFLIQYFTKYKVKESYNWFIKILDSVPDDEKKEIIHALGELGEVKAVEHLQKYTTLKNYTLHIAVQKSIEKLQKNIPVEYQGDLTLSEINESGELSISDNNNDGRLSVEE